MHVQDSETLTGLIIVIPLLYKTQSTIYDQSESY
uniref:Uncharacterized protein n=1 Tax=Leviviridae sp. TaxID=2027243 RepID=A0A514DBL7_9VIRU|nr:MAG: hypothetical protein H4Bulk46761_000001 [Leviviridae sp.]